MFKYQNSERKREREKTLTRMFKQNNSLYFKINFFDQWKYLMDYMDSSNEGVNYLFILGSDITQFQSVVI